MLYCGQYKSHLEIIRRDKDIQLTKKEQRLDADTIILKSSFGGKPLEYERIVSFPTGMFQGISIGF